MGSPHRASHEVCERWEGKLPLPPDVYAGLAGDVLGGAAASYEACEADALTSGGMRATVVVWQGRRDEDRGEGGHQMQEYGKRAEPSK